MLLNYRLSILSSKNKYTFLKLFQRGISFHDLGVSVKLTRMLRSKGIRDPTEIQEKTIQSLFAGKNIVINSETGSGKTLAYALPMISKIHQIKRRKGTMPLPYGLVVVPSLELQYQVSSVFSELLGANVCCASEQSPLRLLNTDVVVSTPLYLMTYPLDIFKQVQTVVFDEADIMIAKKVGKHGVKDPVFKLVKHLLEPSHFHHFNEEETPSIDVRNDLFENEETDKRKHENLFNINRQFVFVGATMPDNEAPRSKVAMKYISSWIPDIDIVKSDNVNKLLSNIDVVYNKVLEGNKLKMLIQTLKELKNLDKLRVLVFVNKYETANSLHHKLTKFRHKEHIEKEDNSFVSDLYDFHLQWEGLIHIVHRDIKVNERMDIFQEFSSTQRGLIITTDVACRGLDLPDVDVVIQYEFATNIIDVLHRSGRTGRMGKQGRVVNFITENDERLSDLLEEATASGESLETFFSRRRSLSKKFRRAEKHHDDEGEETTEIVL